MIGRVSLLAVALALTIAGCSTTPPAGTVSGVSDGAPLKSISPADVEDAVPRADPILAVGNKSPYTVLGHSYTIMDDPHNYREEGIASWYGSKFNGRKTSNGEIFDLYQATAAHKTLPIPSYVRVTNQDNGRSIVVRVNDRGPFHADRIIDLSYGAAVKLGYMAQGTARVAVEYLNIAGVDDRRGNPSGSYRYLQIGAYGQQQSALALQAALVEQLAAPVFISPVQSGQQLLYRVRIGPIASGEDLQGIQQQLQSLGYDQGQPLP